MGSVLMLLAELGVLNIFLGGGFKAQVGEGPNMAPIVYYFIGFGGRSALSAYISWDGSDQMAHTPEDTLEKIDPNKLKQVGQTTMLVVSVLSREVDY